MKFVAHGGSNTGNKQSQLERNICCATKYKKMLPVLLGLKAAGTGFHHFPELIL